MSQEHTTTTRAKASMPPGQGHLVAVIDVGANSIRMELAQILPAGTAGSGSQDDRGVRANTRTISDTDDTIGSGHPAGTLQVLERAKRPVRLGQDTFATGRLSQATMNAAIAILRDYRRMLDTYQQLTLFGAERDFGSSSRPGPLLLRAVATSAVREAANAEAFIDRVYMATHIDLEIIEPSEESRLTVGAVRDLTQASGMGSLLLGDNKSPVLVAEIGGGTASMTMLREGEIVVSGSYRLGSIRLQESLSTTYEPAVRAAELIRHQIAGIIAPIHTTIPLDSVGTFVAVGGDARFVARQVLDLPSDWKVCRVSAEQFDEFTNTCTSHSADELARMYNMTFADAETLVPALLAYQSLMHQTQASELIVPRVSMRDGLLLDMSRTVTGREDEHLANSIIRSAANLGEKYRYDPKHGGHVADLAVRLFDALQNEHRLKSRYRLLLRVAAILHEIGSFVNPRMLHKHTYYLLANVEMFGLRRTDQMIVAHVARYHRRSPPKQTHLEYMSLPRDSRMIVSKLAAILRIADALDSGRNQQIRDFDIERQDDELYMYVRAVPDLTLERKALNEKADLFEDIYGLKVRLEEAAMQLWDARRARSLQ